MSNLYYKKYNPIDYTIAFINMYPTFRTFKLWLTPYIDFHTLDDTFEPYYNRMVNVWRNYLLVYPTDARNNIAVASYVNQILGLKDFIDRLNDNLDNLGTVSTHYMGDNQNVENFLQTKDVSIDTLKTFQYITEQKLNISNQINAIIKSMKVIFVSYPLESVNQLK